MLGILGSGHCIGMCGGLSVAFAINSRTTTRDIILKFDGNVDRKSSVWRMMPTERARLVLSDRVQIWMEENFSANDEIQIAATKVGEKEIEIDLALVD